MEREREPRPERPSPFDERPMTFAPILRPKVDETPRDALRAQWPLLLPILPAIVCGVVLATSQRVWTEVFVRSVRRGVVSVVPLGKHALVALVVSLVAYVLLPNLLAWFVRVKDRAAAPSPDAPPTIASRAAAWVPRVALLLYLVYLAAWLVREA
jgi:hypothetical protein